MDKWSRRQLHSHSYRVPDSFHGEVVVVVGFHDSGKDIALELSRVAMEVHVSVKSMEGVSPSVFKAVSRHHNLHLHLQVECLCDDGQVMFADGSCVVADSIIYCTGYELSFPFLDTGGLVTVDDDRARRPPIRAHLPAGAGAVALLRGVAQAGAGAAVLRGAGEVGGAGAVRPETAAIVGGDDALHRGVPPRQGGGRRAQAPLACHLL